MPIVEMAPQTVMANGWIQMQKGVLHLRVKEKSYENNDLCKLQHKVKYAQTDF